MDQMREEKERRFGRLLFTGDLVVEKTQLHRDIILYIYIQYS